MIVADSTVLVALSLIGQAELMRRLFGKVMVSSATIEEMRNMLAALAPGCQGPSEDGLSVVAVDVPAPAMSISESETMEVCRREQAKLLVSDDAVVRREARKGGINCIGTLGVLYAASGRGLLTDLSDPLARLRAAGCAVSPVCEEMLLKRAAQ